MRSHEFINEGRNHPCIVVDIQPAYKEYDNSVSEKVINFVNKQTGPVLMFVNAERDGMTDDTVQDVITMWDEIVLVSNFDYDSDQIPNKIDWKRFIIVDKGYLWFRSYMDSGVEPANIIKLIRYMYQHRYNDAREIKWPSFGKRTEEETILMHIVQDLQDEPFIINWTSVAQLKKFNGAYIMGGGRNECLREVELLMNAFNIKY